MNKSNSEFKTVWMPLDSTPLRFYAGQMDPADRAHFAISYTAKGQAGKLDGWLRPDGKTVVLKDSGGGLFLEDVTIAASEGDETSEIH